MLCFHHILLLYNHLYSDWERFVGRDLKPNRHLWDVWILEFGQTSDDHDFINRICSINEPESSVDFTYCVKHYQEMFGMWLFPVKTLQFPGKIYSRKCV